MLNVTTSCRLAWLLVVHTNQVVDEYHDMKDNAYMNTAPMDRDISGFERQQAEILAQLEPIFEKYTNLQVGTFTQSSAAHMASLAFSCACYLSHYHAARCYQQTKFPLFIYVMMLCCMHFTSASSGLSSCHAVHALPRSFVDVSLLLWIYPG